MSQVRYFSAKQRLQRTLLAIAFFYALLNGSDFNIIFGAWWLIARIIATGDTFWAAVGVAVVVIALLALALFMVRRWRLAVAQTNLALLVLRTVVVTAPLAIAVVVAGKLSTPTGAFEIATYWAIFQWLWQIPAGFFIGTGLSWAIVDRKMAGIFATDERPLEHEGGAS